jgi:hypothetical protein
VAILVVDGEAQADAVEDAELAVDGDSRRHPLGSEPSTSVARCYMSQRRLPLSAIGRRSGASS